MQRFSQPLSVPGPIRCVVASAAVVAALAACTASSLGSKSTTAAPATTQSNQTSPIVSESTTSVAATTTEASNLPANVRSVADHTLVRLNSYATNVPAPNDFSTPDAGSTFSAVELEVCAGDASYSVNPLYFSLNTTENRLIEPDLGSGSLGSYTLPAHGCTRGSIYFSVPQGAAASDLVVTEGFREVTRIPVSAAQPASSPLVNGAAPTAVALEAKVSTPEAGDATLHAVKAGVTPSEFTTLPKGATLYAADVEVCATSQGVSVNPLYWHGITDQNTIVSAELAALDGQLESIEPAVGACVRGNVGFVVNEGEKLVAVTYTDALDGELGRWAVG